MAPRRHSWPTPARPSGGGLPIATLVVNLRRRPWSGALVLALFACGGGGAAVRDRSGHGIHRCGRVHPVGRPRASSRSQVINATPTLDPLFGQSSGALLARDRGGSGVAHHDHRRCGPHGADVRGAHVDSDAPGRDPRARLADPDGNAGPRGDGGEPHGGGHLLVLHILAAAVGSAGSSSRRRTARDEPVAAADDAMRYSSIALVAFLVVAVSGTVRASIGLVGWQNLLSPYGILVLVKVIALVAMGILGAWYRRRLIARMADEEGSRRFWGVVLLEWCSWRGERRRRRLARTPPPRRLPSSARPPAEVLTGSPSRRSSRSTAGSPRGDIDCCGRSVAGWLFFYLAGVWRLRRRGDSGRSTARSSGRSACCRSSGSPRARERVPGLPVSVHMIEHMLLSRRSP